MVVELDVAVVVIKITSIIIPRMTFKLWINNIINSLSCKCFTTLNIVILYQY